MKYSIISIVLVSLFCLVASCKKSVSIDEPINQLTAEKVFSSDATATSALLGVYSQMMPLTLFFSSGGTTIYTGMMSDELYPTNANSTSNNAFHQVAVSPALSTNRLNFWLRLYRHIEHINAVLEGVDQSTFISSTVRHQIEGEAKFLRAFCFFTLVNLYGDVPLTITTDYKVNSTLKRANKADVWKQIEKDLEDAKLLLTDSYVGQGRVRPNRSAAVSLLSRLYLYMEDWTSAEKEATEVINKSDYLLHNNLNDIFLHTSQEAIWQLMPVENGFNTTEARSFIPAATPTGRPTYALNIDLVNSFENGDKRKIDWVSSKTVATTTYFYPTKYKINSFGLAVTEYYMVLRLAEVVLIRAEARAQLGKVNEAVSDLNLIRNRAGLPAIVNATNLLSDIEKERRHELFAEWGHRWFDLVRTGRAPDVLAPIKPNWQQHKTLLPIPESEILLNSFLTQNPGY